MSPKGPECPAGLDGSNPPDANTQITQYVDDPDFPDKRFRLFATKRDQSFQRGPNSCAMRRSLRNLGKSGGNFDMEACRICARGTATTREPKPQTP